MPYIGNNHIAGDHTNNFKVLDDISSYTATFDGSATSVVDTTNNTIRVVEHRFIQGQRVTYTNGGGGNIGGLTTDSAYFVIFDSASTIKLATSASNAANSTAINLSAVGSGSSHTLNAAFDGVNKKFKLTHGSGTGARLNNATQINVAINNVVQRPNLDPNNFTDGFALEDNHKIVFQTAPTSEDIFWGSIIANTLTTFDISDHKIDTFTGDGSTTEFTLSHTPANNESLMVTINGVLQHPSNASTARAYTLIASIIQFTAAPGVGDEIQVRHMGFAGATTADVSGFYGRTGNVVLTSNDHITTGNINAGIVTATSFDGTFSSSVGGSNANFTGIVTAGTFKGGNIDAVDGAFSGNVTIGGTLTYEDVTNIDSVGIITAQSDIHVGAGLSVVGVTTFSDTVNVGTGVTILSNGRAEFTGLTTFSAGAHIPFGKSLVFGPNSLYGSIGYLSGFSGLQFHALNQMKFSCWDGDSIEQFLFASGVGGYVDIMGTNMANNGTKAPRLRVAGHVAQAITMSSSDGSNLTERFKLSQSGFNFTGLSTHTGNFDLDGDLDVDGHTNLDNVSIAGVTTVASRLLIGTTVEGHQVADDLTIVDTSGSGTAGITIRSDNDKAGRIYFSDAESGDGEYRGFINYYHNGDELRLGTNAVARLILDSSGHLKPYVDSTYNLGTSALRFANLYTDSADLLKDLNVDGHTNLDNVSIAGVTTTNQINISSSGPRITFSDSNENPDFYIEVNASQFLIQDATNNAQRFRIQSDGTVDIAGNANFDSGIDVTGNVTSTGNVVANGTMTVGSYGVFGSLVAADPGSNYYGTTNRFGGGLSLQGELKIDGDIVHIGDTNTKIRFPVNDTVTVETSGSERLRIDSSGRVLIGTTASRTTNSHTPALQISGDNYSEATVQIINVHKFKQR